MAVVNWSFKAEGLRRLASCIVVFVSADDTSGSINRSLRILCTFYLVGWGARVGGWLGRLGQLCRAACTASLYCASSMTAGPWHSSTRPSSWS